MQLPKINPQQVSGKTVLVRVDYNVPLKKVGDTLEIADDRRILASLETIHFLLQNHAKVVLLSHLGRPKNDQDQHLSLKPIVSYFSRRHRLNCQFLPKLNFAEIRQKIDRENFGQLFLLENLRFDPGEKTNDLAFGKKLAGLGDIFVNEAFSTSHRKHASTYTLAKLLPHFAGFGLIKEVETLEKLLAKPPRPFVCVIGGAKIADKVEAISNLAQKADVVLIGGSVANTFLAAEGIEIFRSRTEEMQQIKGQMDHSQFASDLIKAHRHERMLKDGYIPLPKILYPTDVIAGLSLEEKSFKEVQIFELTYGMKDQKEHEKWQFLDIGPKTQRLYREIISQAGTIFWNGPMGVWENPLFAHGTHKIAQSIADADATSIVGGGDTINAIDHFGLNRGYSYISTGGGATLQLLSGDLNPGIAILLQ